MNRPMRNLVLLFLLLAVFLLSSVVVSADEMLTAKAASMVGTSSDDNGNGNEDCLHRLLINITGCPPADLSISGWTGFDETDYAAGSGDKRFDEAWTGEILDVGFDSGVPYRFFAWSDESSWVYLFDFESTTCGDQYASYDFACAPALEVYPAESAVEELPETGSQGGMGWWPWALAGAVALLAMLRWRKLASLVK